MKKGELVGFVSKMLKIKAASSSEIPFITSQLKRIISEVEVPKEIWEKLLTVNGCLDFVIANKNWAQKEEEQMTEEQKTETM